MVLRRENSHFCNNLDPVHPIWTKFCMDIQLDPRNKPAEEFFSKSKMAAGGQKFATRYTYECFCNNLDSVHRIQTKFGMDILLDPRNKLVEEFFIFLKIQDGRRRSKIEFRHNFGSKFTFRLGKWIPFIRFGQNLPDRYYSTLGTSLRNNL